MQIKCDKIFLLKEYNEKSIQRGEVLICKDSKKEQYIYLMLCEIIGTRFYKLLIISGYKAGLPYVEFPEEALFSDAPGISTRWLINNWKTWGYIDSDIENVYISNRLKG